MFIIRIRAMLSGEWPPSCVALLPLHVLTNTMPSMSPKKAAGFPFAVHSHMLRHSCGYKLANDGQDTRAIQHYLGHRSITSTVRYTALADDRFRGFWKD